MKKIILLFVFGIVILLIFVLTNPIRSILSIKKIDNTPFYSMYNFETPGLSFISKIINNKVHSNSENESRYQCSTFVSYIEPNNPILGKNFDWGTIPSLIVFDYPLFGYKSVYMISLGFLGVNSQELTLLESTKLLSSPHFISDGMNEYGLAVSIMSVDYANPPFDATKPTIFAPEALREILYNCKNVNEALKIISDFNINFAGFPAHIQISDNTGHSVVVEYLEEKMNVIESKVGYQISTNFIQSNRAFETFSNDLRYSRLNNGLINCIEKINVIDPMSLLKDVSVSNTRWSVIYGLKTGEINISLNRKYDKVYDFKLEMK